MGDNYKLDYSGLVCPMPVAKTKRQLNQMKSGETLEVSGDFCEAGENIKRFVETNGGEILDFNVKGENYYIRIKKS